MRWKGRRQSSNVEDRRGSKKAMGKGTGLIGIIVLLVGAYYGVDLSGVVNLGQQVTDTTTQSVPVQETQAEQQLNQFSRVILAETEDIWSQQFTLNHQQYTPAKLVLYRGATRTACGTGQSVMGPFYCPADQKIYLDLSFYDDMRSKLKAGGEFAFAYVIAHEIGHHVQNLLGITSRTQQLQRQSSQAKANQISVMVELQADCFAGIWAKEIKNKQLLDEGDVEEAFAAAQAVGDDRLQQQQTGRVIPDSFTHGTSEQRLSWFRRGLNSQNMTSCDTFSGGL